MTVVTNLQKIIVLILFENYTKSCSFLNSENNVYASEG